MTTYERSTILLLLIFANVIFVLSDCNALDKYFYIQHQASHLVLTSRGTNVNLQTYDESYTWYQQWLLKLAPRTGLFIIQVKYSVGALDFNKDNYTIVRYDENDSIYQQWFVNMDGTIVNGALHGYGLTVNRTSFDQDDLLFMAPIENVGEENIFELVEAENYVKNYVNKKM